MGVLYEILKSHKFKLFFILIIFVSLVNYASAFSEFDFDFYHNKNNCDSVLRCKIDENFSSLKNKISNLKVPELKSNSIYATAFLPETNKNINFRLIKNLGNSLSSFSDDLAYGWAFFINGYVDDLNSGASKLSKVSDVLINKTENISGEILERIVPKVITQNEATQIVEKIIVREIVNSQDSKIITIKGDVGPMGPQGPKGDAGPSGRDGVIEEVDFVTFDFLDRQINRVYDSISDKVKNLKEDLNEEITTNILTVSNDAHFLGDLYANNLILTGSVTSGDTTFSNLSIIGNTILGDEATDAITVNGAVTFTGSVNGLTKDMVGLSNVPNLSFSGNNTGDETTSSIKTKLGVASGSTDGYLTSIDWNTFNNKVSSQWGTSGNDIYYNSGNIGIGTNSPQALLHLSTTSGGGEGVMFTDTSASAGNKQMRIQFHPTPGGTSPAGIIFQQVNDDNSWGADLLTIRNNGRIGIGTNTPISKLHVEGNVYIKNPSGYMMSLRDGTNNQSVNFYNTDGRFGVVNNFNSETFSILQNGNVGIGTTTPTHKLEVVGDAKIIGSSSNTGLLKIYGGSGNSQASLVFGYGLGGDISSINSATNNFSISSATGAPIRFNTGTSERMRIDNLTGNVGIGNTNPGVRLHIQNTSASPQVLLKLDSDSAADGAGEIIHFVTSTDEGVGVQIGGYRDASGGTGSLRFSTYLDGRNPGLLEAMRITGSGDVGIGTTNPLSKLNLNGGVGSLATGLTFGDGDTGFFELVDDNLIGVIGGSNRFRVTYSYLDLFNNNGARIVYGNPSGTVPVFVPNGSDDNTGIGTAGTDILSLIAGGTNGLNVNSSGNVGIGTTSPVEALDVNGNIHSLAGSYLQFGTTGTHTLIKDDALNGRTAIQARNNTIDILTANGTTWGTLRASTISGSSAVSANLTLDSTSNATKGFVLINPTGGNVGIGTTNPTENLHVVGFGRITQYLSVGTPGAGFILGASSGFYQGSGSVNRGSINFGAATVGNSSPVVLSSGDGVTYTGGYLQFKTDGAERLRIDSVGNVGIGTTAPYKILTVNANSDGEGIVVKRNSATADTYADIGFTLTTTDIAPTTYFRAYRRTSYSDNDLLLHVGNSDAMYIKSNGNVGIGTNNPGSPLVVVNSSTSSDNTLSLSSTGGATRSTNINFSSIGGTGLFQLDFAGNMVFRTSQGGLYFDNNGTGNTYFRTTSSQTARMTILNNGNIGIGTTSPNYKLDVIGDMNLGAITSSATTNYFRLGTYTTGGYGSYVAATSNYAGTVATNLMFGTTNTAGTLAEKMRIDNNGNVGIGTTGPLSVFDMYKTGYGSSSKGATFRDNITPTYASNADNLLTVRGTGDSSSTWRGRITAGGDNYEFLMGEYNNHAWLGAHNAILNAWADLYIQPDGTAKTLIGRYSTKENTILTIDNNTGNSYFMNGNVGIGTTTPNAKLDTVGSIRTTQNSTGYSEFTHVNAVGSAFYPRSYFKIYGNGTETNSALYVAPGNAIGATQQKVFLGLSTNENVKAAGSKQLLTYLTTSAVHFVTNDGEVSGGTKLPWYFGGTYLNGSDSTLALLANGNVGIGTTSPNAKLEVSNGDIYVFGGSDRRFLVGDNASTGQYGGFRWQSGDDSVSFGHSNSSVNLRNIAVQSNGNILLNSGINGNVGIGTTTPTALLHLKAGTATAGTAPLKFTSGTLLGTTEAGAIEFNNDAYYGTITTGAGTAGARKQFAFTSDLVGGYIPYTGGTSNVDLGIHNLTVDTNSLFVDSVNHRVGIKTTSPTTAFQVGDTSSAGNYVRVLGTDTENTYDVFRGEKKYPRFTLKDTVAGGAEFSFWNLGNQMRFGTNSGNVDVSSFVVYSGNRGSSLFNGDLLLGVYGNDALTVSRTQNIIVNRPYSGYPITAGILNIQAGGSTPSSTNNLGGDLNLKSGISTGTGTSAMHFFTATAGTTGTADNTPTEKMTILGNGNVGIGTTAPSYNLHVGNNTVSGIVARFENSTGTCDINPTTSSLVCSSDINLKKNITTLDGSEFILNENIEMPNSTLEKVIALTPVMYNWNNENDNASKHAGFIAQETEQLFPDIVFTDDNGIKSIAYTNLLPYTIEAIKELNLKVKDLSSLDIAIENSLGFLIKTFLADTANQLSDLYVSIVHTDKVETKMLCVGDTCVTEEQFLEIVNKNVTTTTIVPDTTTTSREDTILNTDTNEGVDEGTGDAEVGEVMEPIDTLKEEEGVVEEVLEEAPVEDIPVEETTTKQVATE